MPFWERPELYNADGRNHSFCNLITLCMSEGKHCLYTLGHGSNFVKVNRNVRLDAAEVLQHPERFESVVKKAARLAL